MIVYEFFSGIGGMHQAAISAGVVAKQWFSFDIDVPANSVYSLNYGVHSSPANIATLKSKDLENEDEKSPVIWLMSPPCQPYTRQGKQEDVNDPRAKPLLNLISVLDSLKRKPDYILLENVKNFETSISCKMLKVVLTKHGYNIREILISPLDIGIPYQRLRYYLLAGKTVVKPIEEEVKEVPTISEYLHNVSNSQYNLEEFVIPDSVLTKTGTAFGTPKLCYIIKIDIVKPTDKKAICFTHAYGKYVKGTGSVYQFKEKSGTTNTMLDYSKILRYFTPSELLRFHGFPLDFKFPPSVSIHKQYKLIGNSLSVDVVAFLLKHFT